MVATLRERIFIDVGKKYTPAVVKTSIGILQTRLRNLWGKHYCPVCNSRINAFQPLPECFTENLERYGWPYKGEDAETCNLKDYSCPFCHANDRDRLYALYLQRHLEGLKANRLIEIIDFAPSVPLAAFMRRQIARSEQPTSYRTANDSGVGVDDKVDITDLRIYSDNRFDFFICSHVLEHVTDDRKAMRELYRILQPGGKGILMVPIILSLNQIDEDPTVSDVGERWRRFGQDDHLRVYSKLGFIERVKESGFLVHQYGQDFFGEDLFVRSAITSQSVLYVVEK